MGADSYTRVQDSHWGALGFIYGCTSFSSTVLPRKWFLLRVVRRKLRPVEHHRDLRLTSAVTSLDVGKNRPKSTMGDHVM